MRYNLLIFNQYQVGEFSENALIDAINESNLATLCEQYGLDSRMIEPALWHLEVVKAPDALSPFFALVRYGDERKRPLIINRWDASEKSGKGILQEGLNHGLLPAVREHFWLTREIFALEFDPAQLKDMGLVFAYEVARWVAFQRRGIVRGLDGCWYRLNCHKAFVPLLAPGD